MITRVARDAVVACVAIALGFALWRRNVASPLGVLGGGLLMAMSSWAIRGTVDDLVLRFQGLSRRGPEGTTAGKTGRKSAGFTLVKFFTRHGIVALAAYGMMVRLRLDPVGMLAGVASVAVAGAVEAIRDLRWRRLL